jgi:hypothetical protein
MDYIKETLKGLALAGMVISFIIISFIYGG